MTRFVYDDEDILFELDGNNQIKARYTHGPGVDEPISVERDTNSDGTLDSTYYYGFDGLGSVTTMADTNGNAVQTYTYDAFGKVINETGAVENSYTYTARERDAEAGLYYYRARFYDAGVGRFISNDPIGFNGGVNFYIYVQNDPVNWVDPLGLWPFLMPKPKNLKENARSWADHYFPKMPTDKRNKLVDNIIDALDWDDFLEARKLFKKVPENLKDLTPDQKKFTDNFFDKLPNENPTCNK